jgi:hypothetical protein
MTTLARKAGISLVAAASGLLVAAPTVQASTQAQGPGISYDADASECLSGDAGPYDTVASVDEWGFDDKYLYCGDLTKGVLHINEGHPINEDGDDDDDIATCVENFGSYGSQLPDGTNPNNYVMEMPIDKDEDGNTDDMARLAYDKNTNDDDIYPVVSLHTTQKPEFPLSNDWDGCANYVNTDAA